MRARSAFYLRNIGLTNTLAALLADGANQFLLRHGAAQRAQGALDLTQVTNFLCQSHITNRNINIADCYLCQGQDLLCS